MPVDTKKLNKNMRTSGVSRGSWVGGSGRDGGGVLVKLENTGGL